jgi:hypothetical protein
VSAKSNFAKLEVMGGSLTPLHPKAGTTKTQRNRTPYLALAVVVILFFGVLFFWFMAGYVHAAPFEATAWKANSLDGEQMGPTRLRMIDDLFKLHLLKGRTGDEVQMLLGPADRTQPNHDRDLLYALGHDPGSWRLDVEWLVIRLNSSGRVSDYWVETIKD